MTTSPLVVSAVFLFGLCVGSFLNVCVWRLPSGEQVIRGRSRCMTCAKTILWHDNIPLLSFMLLGGECRNCKTKISALYPAVELVTGLLLAGVVARFGWTPLSLVYGTLCAALVLLSVIDLREMILPDEITIPGLPVAFVFCYFVPELHHAANGWYAMGSGFLGALTGAGLLWVVGVIGSLIFRKEAMGLGDVKLMAVVGALLGWEKVLLVNMILAPFSGSLVGIIVKIRYKISLIPYGPFLSLGTLAAIFWGDAVIQWYTGFYSAP